MLKAPNKGKEKTLYAEVRRLSNLFSAWRHVRSSAASSADRDIRSEAESFELEAFARLSRISRKLAARTYRFDKVEGVLKDKAQRERVNKPPRPLVIATLESRVVQRALLQVLQPPSDSKLYQRIGLLREIAESPFNFGGTRDGGVPRAVANVLRDLSAGYNYFYKSDIGSFFTRIPHDPVLDFIRCETNEPFMAEFFREGLQVELANREQLTEYFWLFPSAGIGVPQGSSLSALSGNILLHRFDQQINSLDGIRCYRYIDDILILGRTNEMLQNAIARARNLLKQFNMQLYPTTNKEKAASGSVRSGISYLGIDIKELSTTPSRQSRVKLLSKIDMALASAK